MNFRSWIALPLVIIGAGCTSYGNTRSLDAIPMPADPESRYEVWSGGENWQLHAVRIDGDTLRGVRWWHEPSCDSCQVALAKSTVDSVRTSRIDGNKTGALLLFITPFVAAALWFAGMSSD